MRIKTAFRSLRVSGEKEIKKGVAGAARGRAVV